MCPPPREPPSCPSAFPRPPHARSRLPPGLRCPLVTKSLWGGSGSSVAQSPWGKPQAGFTGGFIQYWKW